MAFLLVTITFMISEINIVTKNWITDTLLLVAIQLLISRIDMSTSNNWILDIKNKGFYE